MPSGTVSTTRGWVYTPMCSSLLSKWHDPPATAGGTDCLTLGRARKQ